MGMRLRRRRTGPGWKDRSRLVAGWVAATLAAVLLASCTNRAAGPPSGGETASAQPPGVFPALLRADVMAFLDEWDTDERVRAVLVHHDGRPVLEHYQGAGPEDHWDVEEVTSAVISAVVGVALDRGEIDGLDQTLAELLPDYRDRMDRETARVTLRSLLEHTAGFPWGGPHRAYWGHPDCVGAILDQRSRSRLAENELSAGGHQFSQSDHHAHLVAAVLTEATGRTVLDYARDHLFDPIGVATQDSFEPVIEDADSLDSSPGRTAYRDAGFAWPVDPQGRHEGSCCLKLRPADLARLGQLYLADGRWEGRQVLPEPWVRDSTTDQVPDTYMAVGQGYLWWTSEVDGDAAFLARGAEGTLVHVTPERDLVVVVAVETDRADPNHAQLGGETATSLAELVVAPHFDS